METFGDIIKKLREEKEVPLRIVASYLKIDIGLLSKMERGQRKPTRTQVLEFAKYFKVTEKELLIAWLSDKILYEVADEEIGLEALKLAEEMVEYRALKKLSKTAVNQQIKKTLSAFAAIEKAWIFGSFSRGNDGVKSDIDLAIKTDPTFSYFDLAEIKFELEKTVKRKVDLGFIDSFKPFIYQNLKDDLKLIYERSARNK